MVVVVVIISWSANVSLTSLKMSWRYRNGGLPSSLSVRGGFLMTLPSVSWVFFTTAPFMAAVRADAPAD